MIVRCKNKNNLIPMYELNIGEYGVIQSDNIYGGIVVYAVKLIAGDKLYIALDGTGTIYWGKKCGLSVLKVTAKDLEFID